MVLSYSDVPKKSKTKWLPQGLSVNDNKEKVEKLLMEAQRGYESEYKPIHDTLMLPTCEAFQLMQSTTYSTCSRINPRRRLLTASADSFPLQIRIVSQAKQ